MSKEVRYKDGKKPVVYKDPNMYSEGVLAYREQFDLTPNRGYRADIAATIKTYDDLIIWSRLLASWGYTDRQTGKWKSRNPLDVKSLLTCFEFKKREKERENAIQQERRRVHSEKSLSERAKRRVPESVMPSLLARTRM